MRKNLWIRLLTLCLALICTVGVVASAAGNGDRNGDNVVNVWDLQMVKDGSDEDKATVLSALLGGGDELHPNADGQYEIWSMLGIHNLIRKAKSGASFKLMADIDLSGYAWKPLSFYGQFDGAGHTISNVNITEDVQLSSSRAMGFFASLFQYKDGGESVQSQVKNLHLENVNLTAAANTEYLGLLAGTNKGIITNCTATGSITDTRTQLPADTYVGALVGCNENTTPAGRLEKGTDLLTATAGTANSEDAVEGISAKLAVFLAELSYPETAQAKPPRTLGGIAGYSAPANIDQSMLWQDITGSIAYKSETEQARRNAVVDKMRTMGTVKWTASETVASLKTSGGPTSTHSNLYVPGYTYTGMPYVASYNGSYERFLSKMQQDKDGDERYVTVFGLEDGTVSNGVATGVVRYLGNNCSMAVGWAWAQISPSHVSNTQNGAVGNSAYTMVPNEYTTSVRGVRAVGNYQTLPTSGKYTDAADAQDTIELIQLNGGASGMAEYYAQASRGDALVFVDKVYNEATDSYSNDGAHARLLAADPVIIRNYQTAIDLDKSYVITHEQGDGLYDNATLTIKDIHNHGGGESCEDCEKYGQYTVKASSWRIDHKYSLNLLLSQEGYTAAEKAGLVPGSGFGYVPVTIPAFSVEGALNAPYYNEYKGGIENHPVAWPNTGWYYSNYLVTSVTMVIKDAQNNEVYNKTEFATLDGKISQFSTIKLERDFPDAAAVLSPGQTYTVTLKATASTGKVTTIAENVQFTTPAAS